MNSIPSPVIVNVSHDPTRLWRTQTLHTTRDFQTEIYRSAETFDNRWSCKLTLLPYSSKVQARSPLDPSSSSVIDPNEHPAKRAESIPTLRMPKLENSSDSPNTSTLHNPAQTPPARPANFRRRRPCFGWGYKYDEGDVRP